MICTGMGGCALEDRPPRLLSGVSLLPSYGSGCTMEKWGRHPSGEDQKADAEFADPHRQTARDRREG